MQGAVSLVKDEFGQDALILQTRKVRRRGILRWLRPPQYEVVAALEGVDREAAQETRPVHAAKVSATYTPPRPVIQVARDEGFSSADVPTDSRHTAKQGEDEALAQLRQHLLDQDVDESVVTSLVNEVAVQSRLHQVPLTPEQVREVACQAIARNLVCIEPEMVGSEGRVIPLVGPTGVGKTTTLAKLAANFALLAKKRVAILTTDTYRIAAVDQLRTYAELIEVPFEVVYTPDELRDSVDRHQDKDMIFVDTAGRSQQHREQLKELAAFLEVIESPLTHLVVSAGTKLADLLEVSERFAQLAYERIIVTKLDETRTYGAIYTLGVRTRKPIAYLTNGQNVPDDIDVAESHRIAQLIMGGRGDGSS